MVNIVFLNFAKYLFSNNKSQTYKMLLIKNKYEIDTLSGILIQFI